MAVLSSQSQPQQQQQQPSSSSCTSSCSTGSKSQPKFHPVDDYKKALHMFVHPKDQSRDEPIVGTEGELRFTRSEDPLVDEYFLFVVHEGRPHLPWELIRPAFIWKLRVVMDDMHMMEAEQLKDEHQKELLVANVEIKETKQFVMEKAGEFEGTPFTIQRLCELLIQPTKHYHAAAVFLRALEKNINVVTTITEDGHRITGVDESMGMEEEAPIPVERNFIISVDEMDEPLSKKLARHQQQQQNGSGGGSGDIQQQSTAAADSSRDQKEGESAADGDVEMKQPAEVE